MSITTAKMAAARSFVRSLNILLKFVRLYGFDHARAVEQFDAAWDDLHAAIPEGDETGLLLGTSGSQLILDGVPIEAAHAERSFAQLLSAAGLASIHFLPKVTQEDLALLVRAFPVGNAKPSSLAEELKTALAGTKGIRINELRFFAEDASTTEVRMAASLTAKTLGADASQVTAWLSDPHKLLQLIAASEGSRNGSAATGSSTGEMPGAGAFYAQGTESSGVTGSATSGGSGAPDAGPRDDEIIKILRLLTRFGGSTESADGFGFGPVTFQHEVSTLPGHSRDMLQQALAAVAARAPAVQANDPMLLQLAEHLAIRFALDRYERGEVRVNAVREMLEKMTAEISGLRKILGSHEETLANAGIIVESHADLLDRQFWASVPEAGKRTVLTSAEAWCIPPRNVRQYIQELRMKGDEATAAKILETFATGVSSEDATARRRAAIGIAEMAELYAAGDSRALGPAIRCTGLRLAVERDDELQALISAAFVRLAQEAGGQSRYRAVLQSLDSLDSVENQRPAFAQSVRPRLGLEKRLPDFIETALRILPKTGGPEPGVVRPDGLKELIGRMPRMTAEYLTNRFNRSGYRTDCARIVELIRALGPETAACLRETLQSAAPAEAAETVGLLSRLDATVVEKWLANRMRDWPRPPQDRALRLVAGSGAAERGWLLLSIFDQLDATLQPLAVDEIGMSGETGAVELMLHLAEGNLPHGTGPYLRLKAIEALGRLRAESAAATMLLREIAESKKLWRWVYPTELRLAAFQALCSIATPWAESFFPRSGFAAEDLDLGPLDSESDRSRLRQRRYPRVRLKTLLPATAIAERETIALEVRNLSMSGGLANGEKHLTPGTLVSLKMGSGLRPIRAQAFMRDARAQGLGFEFADMDLEERARLRRFLRENGESILAEAKESERSEEEVSSAVV